jgi:hypothetical protein
MASLGVKQARYVLRFRRHDEFPPSPIYRLSPGAYPQCILRHALGPSLSRIMKAVD